MAVIWRMAETLQTISTVEIKNEASGKPPGPSSWFFAEKVVRSTAGSNQLIYKKCAGQDQHNTKKVGGSVWTGPPFLWPISQDFLS